MQIIKTILQSDWFQRKPPVLIDIGASGEINSKWKLIAPYSICIAFDADDREFHVTEQANKSYKRLFIFNRIVTATPVERADFYLTSSPFCSSLLEPDKEKLSPWIFSSLFETEKKIQLNAITVEQALSQIKIDYIDWFKSDTQGTDLRLFKTLPTYLFKDVLAAELEPGILDAYVDEDKLYMIMEFMHRHGYWLSSMETKGTQRLKASYKSEVGNFSYKRIIRASPGWAEVTYLRQPSFNDQRTALLLYIFALVERQYGFALEIADSASQKFNDPIFRACKKAILKKINSEKWKIPLVIFKRQFNKLFSNIDK